ncbi:MAG: ATP-binding cassette domain-containing protein [Puniceicoccales bacterium]|jgi:ATPase subunit of ABC transporter with duplicated ATPase domains|nr:ATP-binding cassette domain-containing protein [Puniceicoccales bacterium]
MLHHGPIEIKGLGISFPGKVCFIDFTGTVESGSRIAVIGRNGSGKSTLLKILLGTLEPTFGYVKIPADVLPGYVPQIIGVGSSLSGGQRFQRKLTEVLCQNPNLLLLDEPTNHLDPWNRKSLIRMLRVYGGTLVVASHDVGLLRCCVDTLWHIDGEKISAFHGNYDDHVSGVEMQRLAIERKLLQLERQIDGVRTAMVREQRREARSRAVGRKKIERREWLPAIGNDKKNSAERTAGKIKSDAEEKKRNLLEQLSAARPPDVILPKFSLTSKKLGVCTILSVADGAVGYSTDNTLLTAINISLASNGRMAILGKNGSGKSTLAKAILGDKNVIRSGNWHVPRNYDIGYLDQHYDILGGTKSVFDSIAEIVPSWSPGTVRKHLATFLFRKNKEVECHVDQLSGGEKARLSLAKIAATQPKLLILDEITNNLDIETKAHVIQVLKNFPGAVIAISHDNDFLKSVEIDDFYAIDGRCGRWQSIFDPVQ